MAGPGNILITIGAESASAIRNIGSVNKALGDTMTTSEKMSAGLKKAAVPAAAALAGIGFAAMDAAKAAMEDAASADKLAGTLKRVTGATDDTVASVEDYISKTSRATGVADDDLRPAFEKLVVATGDVHKAQKLMTSSMDIAAATGKDLDQVSTAVAKGYQGQTSSLARLVPGLDEGARKSKDFDVIMASLADTTGGAAARAADTAEGKFKRMNVATSELQESIGYALLPVIEATIPMLIKMANFAEDNVGVIKALVAVVAVLASGILAANVAMKAYEAAQVLIKAATVAWTGVQWLLNAALDANPIGAITLLIAGLAAGIVIAYNKSETFRDVVKGAMHVVEDAVQGLREAFEKLYNAAQYAFNWIVDHWKLALFAFGPIGAAIYVLVTRWDQVKAAAETAAGVVASAVDRIGDAFHAAAGAIASAASGIASAIDHVGDVFGAAASRVESACRSIIGWIDRVRDLAGDAIGKIGDLIDWIGRIPKIPSLPGGIHIPLPFAAGVSPMLAGAGGARAPSTAPIVVNVYGALDPESVARQIRRVLDAHDRRHGRIA